MRVLLKDRADQTLMLVEPTDVDYDRDEQELYFYSGDACYVVEHLDENNIISAMQTLFAEGKVDLTAYPSFREVR